MQSNPKPRTISGVTAERPAIANVEAGVTFYDTTLREYFFSADIGGVPTWVSLGGAGTLPDYWVGPAGIVPAAPFNKISDAIAAALADGHTAAKPADIFILPGTYNAEPGNKITMQDGISLRGFQIIGQPGGIGLPDTLIAAQIVFDPKCTKASISNVLVQSNVGDVILVDAGALILANLLISNCIIRQLAAGHVCVSVGGPTPTDVQLYNCNFINFIAQGGVACVNLMTAQTALVAQDCNFVPAVGSDTAISLGVCPNITMERCTVSGSFDNIAGPNAWTLRRTKQTVTGGTPYVNVTAGAPTFVGERWDRSGSTSVTPYVGTFAINEDAHDGDPNTETFLSTMSNTPTRHASRYTAAITPGAAITAAQFQAAGDVVLIDTSGGVGAVALPPRSQVPNGLGKYVLCHHGGLHATTITPDGGGPDKINGVAAPVTGPATVTAGFFLVADPTDPLNWLVMIGA